MNKKQHFYSFLESITDSNNADLIVAVKEAFAITESIHNIAMPSPSTRELRGSSVSTPQAPQDIQARNAERLSAQKKNNVISGRVKSHMTNIVSELSKDPTIAMLVEPWIKETLIPAIKAAKGEKTGVFGKIKGFFGEGVEGEDCTLEEGVDGAVEEENPAFQAIDDSEELDVPAEFDDFDDADEVGGVYGGVKRPTVADKARVKQSRVQY